MRACRHVLALFGSVLESVETAPLVLMSSLAETEEHDEARTYNSNTIILSTS